MTRFVHRLAWGAALSALVALSPACYVEASTAPPGDAYVEAPPPPPPPQQEAVPLSPGADFEWVGGYHRWDGHRYVWVKGRYERRPHANARWRPAHWEARGRGHVWVEGRWN